MNTAPYLPVDVILDSKRANDLERPVFDFEPQLENVVGYEVLWTNIPFSFYTMDDTGRKMIVGTSVLNGWGVTLEQEISFRPGTYTPESLRNQFKAQTAPATLVDGALYDCIIQAENAKLLIWNRSTTMNAILPFFIEFGDTPMAKMLGFDKNTRYVSTFGQIFVNGQVITDVATPTAGTQVNYIEAPYVASLLGPSYLKVHAEFNGMRNDAARTDTGYDQLLATVPITGNFASMLMYQGLPEPISMGATYTISGAKLKLTHGDRTEYAVYKNGVFDKFSNYLPLNGEGYQVCIRFYVDNGVKNPPH